MSYSRSYKGISEKDLKEFLDEKVDLYNRPSFIEHDPISIPHRFTKKEDIEISGFLAANSIRFFSILMDLRADFNMRYLIC